MMGIESVERLRPHSLWIENAASQQEPGHCSLGTVFAMPSRLARRNFCMNLPAECSSAVLGVDLQVRFASKKLEKTATDVVFRLLAATADY